MNNLKEQFSEIIICTEIEGCSKQSDDCVKIADLHAINFAKFYMNNCWKNKTYTVEDIYEIYKKEKEL